MVSKSEQTGFITAPTLMHCLQSRVIKYSNYILECDGKRRVSGRAVGESLTRVRAEAAGRGSNESLLLHSRI